MYRILNAMDFPLPALLGEQVPEAAVLEETGDVRWAGRVAREICLGIRPAKNAKGSQITQVIVRSDDGRISHYDAARATGSRYPSGRPRNIVRVLCSRWPHCENPGSPWMDPRSDKVRIARGQTEPHACLTCRRRHATERHREARARRNREGRNASLS